MYLLQVKYRLHPVAIQDTLSYGRSKSRVGRAKLDKHGEHQLCICMPLIQESRHKDGNVIGGRDGSQPVNVAVATLCVHLLYDKNTMIAIQLNQPGNQGRELGKLLRKSLQHSQSTL